MSGLDLPPIGKRASIEQWAVVSPTEYNWGYPGLDARQFRGLCLPSARLACFLQYAFLVPPINSAVPGIESPSGKET